MSVAIAATWMLFGVILGWLGTLAIQHRVVESILRDRDGAIAQRALVLRETDRLMELSRDLGDVEHRAVNEAMERLATGLLQGVAARRDMMGPDRCAGVSDAAGCATDRERRESQ